jgi:FMN phosphatase YigB (HAD superfamily)
MEFAEKLATKNIVLYGLGTETERTISEWNGQYHMIGLLDSSRKSGEEFGYPILDIQDVVRQENILIVVVARPGSCKVIAKTVGPICREHQIELYDIRGNDLLQEKNVVYEFAGVDGYTRDELLTQIDAADVISFDLFDTLIVRNILAVDDVLELVGLKLCEKGIEIPDFKRKRMDAEKSLSKKAAPKLETIYAEIVASFANFSLSEKELADFEYEIDVSLLQPRTDMVQLLQVAKEKGKKVCITTESYYTRTQIFDILEQCGIRDVEDVFISCEYQKGKLSGLYEEVKKAFPSKKILHIGDDIVADIEAARRYGLEAFQIYSTWELLDMVGGLHLVTSEMSLSDKIKIGMFTAELWNSPFQFEHTTKRLYVNDASRVGYLFMAPMILDFIYWFGDCIKEGNFQNIWFCARDGYLIQTLYKLMYPQEETVYFQTSRTAAIRAGMQTDADIEYVDSMKYSGEVTDCLFTRFGIRVEDIRDEDICKDKAGLLKYSAAILDAAKRKRTCYLRYIEGLNLKKGRIALFDFVAKGTSQMYIQRFVENPITGLYFLQLEPEFMKGRGLDITPFYTEEERSTSAVFDNYYIMETVLTSPYASVNEFDEQGNVLYTSETRTKTEIDCLMKVQEGIIDYVKRYLQICPQGKGKRNKKLDEVFLCLLHHIEIRDKDFLRMTVEDSFFNRSTQVNTII